jgi:hypothetical protein
MSDFRSDSIRWFTEVSYGLTHSNVQCYILEFENCTENDIRVQLVGDLEMAIIARETQLRGKTMALEFYDHFLSARGTTKYVDINKLLSDNDYIKSQVNYRIRQRLNDGLLDGSNDMDVDLLQAWYTNEDWWFALGAIELQWRKIDNNTVELSFENIYRWHPGANRPTQTLHIALDRLTQHGLAQNFLMIGRPTIYVVPANPPQPARLNGGRPEGNR